MVENVLKKELVKRNIEKNFDKVANKWQIILKEKGISDYSEAFKRFIEVHGNLGESQLVRLTKEGTNINRDFAITLEPKEENLNEFQFVLRHIVYNNKTNDGLHTNSIGTVVFGRYELNDFDSLWSDFEFRNKNENKNKVSR